MKKNLRSKILLCVLAGGVLAANTALAAEYTETISGDKDNYGTEVKTSSDGDTFIYDFGENAELKIDENNNDNNGGIYIGRGNKTVKKIEIKDALDITVTNKNNADNFRGIELNGGSGLEGVIIDRSGGGDIIVSAENNIGNTNTAVSGVNVTLGADNIINIGNANLNIKSINSLYKNTVHGIYVNSSNGSKVIMGNGSINTTAKNDTSTNADLESIGVRMDSGAIFEAGDITINSYAEGISTLMSSGLYIQGTDTVADMGIVTIDSKTVGGESGDYVNTIGIRALNNGEINIAGGSIKAEAYNSDGTTENENAVVYAILGQTNSEININKNTTNDVEINGNVRSDDATINLNLNTVNSVLNGTVSDNGTTNGTNLTLANGAEWNNTGASNVKNVSMNGGIINQNSDEDIIVGNYSGTGDINFKAKNNTVDGVLDLTNIGNVTIENAGVGSVTNLSANADNTLNTIDSAKAYENLNAIANKIYYTSHSDGNITGSVKIAEGLITPEVSGDLLFYEDNSNGHTAGQGYVANVKQNSSTTTIDNIKNVAATAIVAWRQEDSTLSQRLGELRESDGGQGIWVRMSRGEFEYDGEYKNQYNFFQMGYDWAAGSWHYGAAVSHNDGQTTYTHGDGENRSTSLSLYGTWLGDKGHYADIVLKQGRLSNDFDIYTEAGHTSGDYDAWGTSLSGEYGMKVDLDGGWYVTPQAQLTLMRIGGEDYTTNNGIKVNQDSLESAVGRVGFEVGKRISGSGSIYAKASLLHDFAGSADTYLSLNGLTNSYHQDIGDTWCEAGIGFNYKTSENSYVYADVVKTFGGDVETPWQWSAGMRWTF